MSPQLQNSYKIWKINRFLKAIEWWTGGKCRHIWWIRVSDTKLTIPNPAFIKSAICTISTDCQIYDGGDEWNLTWVKVLVTCSTSVDVSQDLQPFDQRTRLTIRQIRWRKKQVNANFCAFCNVFVTVLARNRFPPTLKEDFPWDSDAVETFNQIWDILENSVENNDILNTRSLLKVELKVCNFGTEDCKSWNVARGGKCCHGGWEMTVVHPSDGNI